MNPGTRIGVDYTGPVVRRPGETEDEARARLATPARAIGREGYAPVVRNDDHVPTDHAMKKWCVVPGSGVVPRRHRPEHFLVFDSALPHYRRCPRCGSTVYIGRAAEA